MCEVHVRLKLTPDLLLSQDIPNACTTIGLPMDIFDFDISPHVPAEKRDLGACAFAGS